MDQGIFNIAFAEFEPAIRRVEIRIDLVIQANATRGEAEQSVFQLFYALYACFEFNVSERYTSKIQQPSGLGRAVDKVLALLHQYPDRFRSCFQIIDAFRKEFNIHLLDAGPSIDFSHDHTAGIEQFQRHIGWQFHRYRSCGYG